MSFCFQVNILSGFPQVKTIVRPWAQREPVNIYTCVYSTYIYTHNIHIIFSYLQTYSLYFSVHVHLFWSAHSLAKDGNTFSMPFILSYLLLFYIISYFLYLFIQSDIQSSHETKVPTAMPSGFQRWTLRGMHGTTTHSVSWLSLRNWGRVDGIAK